MSEIRDEKLKNLPIDGSGTVEGTIEGMKIIEKLEGFETESTKRTIEQKNKEFKEAYSGNSPIEKLAKELSKEIADKEAKEAKRIQEEFYNAEGVIPYCDFVKTTFAYTSGIDQYTIGQTLDLLHITLGIAGEYIELENELKKHETLKQDNASSEELERAYLKAQKELGDLCYYIYMAANNQNFMIPQINPIFNDGDEFAVEIFVDAVKKQVFYKMKDINLKLYVIAVWSHLCFISWSVFGKPIEFFILQNKEKLMKRYPTGTFRQEDAATKKDEDKNV